MPKRYAKVFTQRTAFCMLPFRELLENPLAKSIVKRIVLIFKHSVVFLHIFTESKVAVTVQLNKLNSVFCKLHRTKIFKNLLQTTNSLQRLTLFIHAVEFLHIFTESNVATTVQLYKLNSFENCTTQRFSKICCRQQLYYNDLYLFSHTLLRFCTIFTESKVR